HLGLVALYGAAVIADIVRAFSGPALSALSPNLVPLESLPTAIAISSSSWQVGWIAGPSVGGLLFALSPNIAYAVCIALLVTAIICLML
ncbi:hypothetical protein ABTN31_18990, partial [Acinetobacter baumannii]